MITNGYHYSYSYIYFDNYYRLASYQVTSYHIVKHNVFATHKIMVTCKQLTYYQFAIPSVFVMDDDYVTNSLA